ncbi:MAG: cytochrome b/b6 domain-containing protein [Lutibacter sp.]
MKFGPKEFKNSMEEFHNLSIYYLIAFIILHIGGVLWSEFTNQKGILSKIVRGNNINNQN